MNVICPTLLFAPVSLGYFEQEVAKQSFNQIYPGLNAANFEGNMRGWTSLLTSAMIAHHTMNLDLGSNGQGEFLDAHELDGEEYRDFGAIIAMVRKFNRLNYTLDDGYQFFDQGDAEGTGMEKSEDEKKYYAHIPAKEGNKHSEVLFDFDFSHDKRNTSFVVRFEGEPMKEMLDVTKEERERHGFLLSRKWNQFVPVAYIEPITDTPIPGTARKRGSSDIIGDQGLGWGAVDTMSVHVLSVGGLFASALDKLLGKKISLPIGEQRMGFGNAFTHDDVYGLDPDGYGGSKGTNKKGHPAAFKSNAENFPSFEPYEKPKYYPVGAIPNFAELGPDMMAKEDPIFNLTARNYRKVSATRTIVGDNSLNSNSVKPSGRLDIYDGNMKGEGDDKVFSAVASAQSVFDRPVEREDGHYEMGNFFNPYWHTRLVTVKPERRKTAQEEHGEDNDLKIYIE